MPMVNLPLAKMLGYSNGELTGASILDINRPEDYARNHGRTPRGRSRPAHTRWDAGQFAHTIARPPISGWTGREDYPGAATARPHNLKASRSR